MVIVVTKGSCGDTAGWIIEFIERRSGVGGELCGVDAPVDDFRVGVSERTSRSRGGGCVERAHVVGVEGCQWRVDVFDLAGCVGKSACSVGFGRGVGIRIDCLPDGEKPVDVGMVQPEDGIEACIWNIAHVSSTSD